jgi:hypothetical protein
MKSEMFGHTLANAFYQRVSEWFAAATGHGVMHSEYTIISVVVKSCSLWPCAVVLSPERE